MLFVVISELTGVESAYEIPDVLWDRVTPLLPSRKKKKKAGRPRMNDRKAMSAIFYVLRTAANGMLFQEVLELQVQYMIDSKNGELLVYSNVCGLMVYLYMIKGLELIGNGKLWMVPLGGKRHRCKSHRQS